MPSRFPPPWYIRDSGGAFVVEDSRAYPVAYVYYREPPTMADDKPTRDQARRIASNIAKLPGLLTSRA